MLQLKYTGHTYMYLSRERHNDGIDRCWEREDEDISDING